MARKSRFPNLTIGDRIPPQQRRQFNYGARQERQHAAVNKYIRQLIKGKRISNDMPADQIYQQIFSTPQSQPKHTNVRYLGATNQRLPRKIHMSQPLRSSGTFIGDVTPHERKKSSPKSEYVPTERKGTQYERPPKIFIPHQDYWSLPGKERETIDKWNKAITQGSMPIDTPLIHEARTIRYRKTRPKPRSTATDREPMLSDTYSLKNALKSEREFREGMGDEDRRWASTTSDLGEYESQEAYEKRHSFDVKNYPRLYRRQPSGLPAKTRGLGWPTPSLVASYDKERKHGSEKDFSSMTMGELDDLLKKTRAKELPHEQDEVRYAYAHNPKPYEPKVAKYPQSEYQEPPAQSEADELRTNKALARALIDIYKAREKDKQNYYTSIKPSNKRKEDSYDEHLFHKPHVKKPYEPSDYEKVEEAKKPEYDLDKAMKEVEAEEASK